MSIFKSRKILAATVAGLAVTGGFGASYIFMSGSLLLSAILTIVALRKKTEAKPAFSL